MKKIIIIGILIIGILIGYFICKTTKVSVVENDVSFTDKKEIVKVVSSFCILPQNDDTSITTEDLYKANMSSTFTELINSKTVSDKLYSKYGNKNKLIVESANEYNTII